MFKHITTQCVMFEDLLDKPVHVQFDDEYSSSNGGAILLKAAEAQLDLTEAPAASCAGQRYSFTPENRLPLVRSVSGGTVNQESQYDASRNRWARVISADGGKGLVTLRDISGQVASEYVESDATSGLDVFKHYARAAGQIIATHTVCGPPPVLGIADPPSTPPDLTLTKSDSIPSTGDYTIVIKSDTGQTTTLPLEQSSPDTFTISTTGFFSREQLDSDQGRSRLRRYWLQQRCVLPSQRWREPVHPIDGRLPFRFRKPRWEHTNRSRC